MLELATVLRVPAPPSRAFAHTVDTAFLTSFVGWGPIPGIASVEDLEPPGPGARRIVHNTDGSTHRETFTAYDPPSRHTARIDGFAAPFAWLVRELVDDWRFVPDGEGTRIERRFTFALTTPLVWPVARLLLVAFRRAVDRHMAAIAAQLSR